MMDDTGYVWQDVDYAMLHNKYSILLKINKR